MKYCIYSDVIHEIKSLYKKELRRDQIIYVFCIVTLDSDSHFY